MLSIRLWPSVMLLAGVVLSSCAHPGRPSDASQAQCAAPVTSGSSMADIRTLEEAGAASALSGWSRETGERMFGPGYFTVGQDGSVRTRETLLANWRSAAWASRFDIKALDIQVYCDMAVAVGLAEALPMGASESTQPAHFRWLNVWTQSSGEWRLAATHFTRF